MTGLPESQEISLFVLHEHRLVSSVKLRRSVVPADQLVSRENVAKPFAARQKSK
jgi:hypothetical protein